MGKAPTTPKKVDMPLNKETNQPTNLFACIELNCLKHVY